jgi:hypothetical protein
MLVNRCDGREQILPGALHGNSMLLRLVLLLLVNGFTRA